MATARPFAYNSNSGVTYSGTTQYGNVVVLNDNENYANIPLEWYNGPDEDLGYVIAHPTGIRSVASQSYTSSGNVIGFWRSSSKTEESFLSLFDSVKKDTGATQSYNNGEDAKTWLENNGYWTSFVTTWNFNSGILLDWPNSTSGYTAYSGSITSFDDGYGTTPITLPTNFVTQTYTSNQLYIWTNGFFTIGDPNDYNHSFMGNSADLWLQPGTTNSEGDTENWWYKTGNAGGSKYYVKNIVYGGIYPGNGSSSSYLANLYIDSQYQWFETRIKSNAYGNAGVNPYSAQTPSTQSQVWRGDLNGANWTYLGYGSIS